MPEEDRGIAEKRKAVMDNTEQIIRNQTGERKLTRIDSHVSFTVDLEEAELSSITETFRNAYGFALACFTRREIKPRQRSGSRDE